MALIVSRNDADFLLGSSLLTIIGIAGAAYFGMYDLAASSASILLCSINYWRRPVRGFRRNIDIVNTVAVLAYNTWHSFELPDVYFSGYVFFATLAFLSFVASHHPTSARVHSGVHIFGNVANTIMYVGLYDQPLDRAEVAIAIMCAAALVDVLFIGGWPPKWWPVAE